MRIAGICELPWTTLLDICRTVSADPSEVRFDYLGVNHLGWFHRLASGGRDILREYAGMRKLETCFPSGTLIESCGGVPLKYLRLHYERDKVVDEQRRQQQTRGEQLEQVSRHASRAYREGDRHDVEAALEMRPSPWYRHAVGPLIASMATGVSRIPLFLSVPNAGLDCHFDNEDILECPHVMENAGLRRLSGCNPVPAPVLELTERFVKYERLGSTALLTGDQRDVEKAIRIHPWLDGVSRTSEMAHEIVNFRPPAAA
jgi:6-phospho-beta-glucosidase